MKKERAIIFSLVGVLAAAGLIAISKSTDVIYVAVSIAFFAICIAYADWCERL